MAGDLRLTIAVLNHGQWDALKDGRVTPDGIELDHISVEPAPAIYRRMVRDLEFDIAEVAITTYLCAKSFDIPITALPVFSNRDVTMAEIVVNVNSGIERPKDLEGKRVGCAPTPSRTTRRPERCCTPSSAWTPTPCGGW